MYPPTDEFFTEPGKHKARVSALCAKGGTVTAHYSVPRHAVSVVCVRFRGKHLNLILETKHPAPEKRNPDV